MTSSRVRIRWSRPLYLLGLLALVCAPTLGCRAAIDNPDEIQTLAGDGPAEHPAETTEVAASGAAPQADPLDTFPLVGSVFPGLGGRLHSSLCDPASDPFSTCL